ncbi:Serine/threonine-protein kinase ssp1 [Cytospora mali]|uniref:non-specific serine/threonine protein kinase n=1 Tax=Cytospora mali TaxID=578113 RepID=A0A194VVH0_CYTMA|nr:Serine/threonine-protein kinase ssp1 [Valsa mali]
MEHQSHNNSNCCSNNNALFLQQPHPLSRPPSRTASSTPVSSPGLFSPASLRAVMSLPPSHSASEGTTPAAAQSPFLHPLQTHRVRETHVANVDRDFTTGRKIINHYEVIEEIGRGVHGKVKLARDLDNGQNVAIKIVPRFSRKRRLGRITQNVSPYEKTKREIAILKKIRHPNVVALLEVIDDPDYKKIYLCLEHVECGEIVWRKKGLPYICNFERKRVEREVKGEKLTDEEEHYLLELERRFNIKEMKRAHLAERSGTSSDHWSLEFGQDETDGKSRIYEADGTDVVVGSLRSESSVAPNSAPPSQTPSRTQSVRSMSAAAEFGSLSSNEDDLETPIPFQPHPNTLAALEGTMYGAYDDTCFRERTPSMADSIISHMSSIDFNSQAHDPFADDFSYVPCFTINEARNVFRDVVLGLEYLHYQGIVHRDIKPANLLWTRDHRVKISDFGVSYFGRPMRDGEPDDTVSESEAQDFDDEVELSKTVGTPAFFAPELCYTDLDSGPPPKVTEQIDVWSLGVTLYCMIFARIPFLAEDEFQMFRKIATENVYIPSRRLRPVDPSTSPKTSSLYNRVNSAPYRDDHQLIYEEVDDSLRHLLEQMLIKDPRKRITLRQVKAHPWVLCNLPNFMGWIDETDPRRTMEGRKIELTDKEVDDAVVPLTLLERARSTLKKTFGKLTQSRSTERTEAPSRRRAPSSAASSAGDSPAYTPIIPHLRDFRRKSLRGDIDYFTTAREHQHSEHPLTFSVTASPDESPILESVSIQPAAVGGHPPHEALEVATDFNRRDSTTDRQTPTQTQLNYARHRHSQSISNAILSLQKFRAEANAAATTPDVDGPSDDFSLLRKGRDMSPTGDSGRAQSADRALVFSSPDKRAEAKVALSSLVAPGNFEQPRKLSQMRSLDLGRTYGESPLPSPHFFSPLAVDSYYHLYGQQAQHKSDPVLDKFRTVVKTEDRPMTAHRVQDIPEGKTPPQRIYGSSTPESFARAQETMRRRERFAYEEELRRRQEQEDSRGPAEIDPALVPCPPSPDDDETINSQAPSRKGTSSTAFSSKSNSGEAINTPWTSPSVVTSPVSYSTCVSHKDLSEADSQHILAFQSDPSLPALLSGASSVSADPEGEFLGIPGNPGSMNRGAFLETTDSVTPPALSKEPVAGFPLEAPEFEDAHGTVRIGDQDLGSIGQSTPTPLARSIDDDDDSDSDEGILIMGHRSKKSNATKGSPNSLGKAAFRSRRRNTNASVGSTDTAKKVFTLGE